MAENIYININNSGENNNPENTNTTTSNTTSQGNISQNQKKNNPLGVTFVDKKSGKNDSQLQQIISNLNNLVNKFNELITKNFGENNYFSKLFEDINKKSIDFFKNVFKEEGKEEKEEKEETKSSNENTKISQIVKEVTKEVMKDSFLSGLSKKENTLGVKKEADLLTLKEQALTLFATGSNILSDNKTNEENPLLLEGGGLKEGKKKEKLGGKLEPKEKPTIADILKLPTDYGYGYLFLYWQLEDIKNLLDPNSEKKQKSKKGLLGDFFEGLGGGAVALLALAGALLVFAGAVVIFAQMGPEEWKNVLIGLGLFAAFVLGVIIIAHVLKANMENLKQFTFSALLLSTAFLSFSVALFIFNFIPFTTALKGLFTFIVFVATLIIAINFLNNKIPDLIKFGIASLMLAGSFIVFGGALLILSLVNPLLSKALPALVLFIAFFVVIGIIGMTATSAIAGIIAFGVAAILVSISLLVFSLSLKAAIMLNNLIIPSLKVLGVISLFFIGIGLLSLVITPAIPSIMLFSATSILLSISLVLFSLALAAVGGLSPIIKKALTGLTSIITFTTAYTLMATAFLLLSPVIVVFAATSVLLGMSILSLTIPIKAVYDVGNLLPKAKETLPKIFEFFVVDVMNEFSKLSLLKTIDAGLKAGALKPIIDLFKDISYIFSTLSKIKNEQSALQIAESLKMIIEGLTKKEVLDQITTSANSLKQKRKEIDTLKHFYSDYLFPLIKELVKINKEISSFKEDNSLDILKDIITKLNNLPELETIKVVNNISILIKNLKLLRNALKDFNEATSFLKSTTAKTEETLSPLLNQNNPEKKDLTNNILSTQNTGTKIETTPSQKELLKPESPSSPNQTTLIENSQITVKVLKEMLKGVENIYKQLQDWEDYVSKLDLIPYLAQQPVPINNPGKKPDNIPTSFSSKVPNNEGKNKT